MGGLSDYFGAILKRVFGDKNKSTEQGLTSTPGGISGNISKTMNDIPMYSGPVIPAFDPRMTDYTPPSQTTPSPAPQRPLQQRIESGLSKFSNPPPPIATMSSQLAQAGQGLPDQLLPAILSLMETGGMQEGKTLTPNNPYNIGPGVNYSDPSIAILGGGDQNQLGLSGLLRPTGLYSDYLQSGDLSQFFNRFTPPSDPRNPSTEELVNRYNLLKALFE
jgi:hypothetical protein